MEYQTAKRKYIWKNIIFFAVTTLTGVVGAPLYMMHHGLSWPVLALFAFYLVATGLSITVGYHRCFAHSTFKAHPVIEFLLLFFGVASAFLSVVSVVSPASATTPSVFFLPPLLRVDDPHGDALTFRQTRQPCPLDDRDVNEDVLPAAVNLDESHALRRAEPLDGASHLGRGRRVRGVARMR